MGRGAHERNRTVEPLPYQGSALPTELRGQSTTGPCSFPSVLFHSPPGRSFKSDVFRHHPDEGSRTTVHHRIRCRYESTIRLQRDYRSDRITVGAGDEIRTRDIQLGRLKLYQLSYSRSFVYRLCPQCRSIAEDNDSGRHLLCPTFCRKPCS